MSSIKLGKFVVDQATQTLSFNGTEICLTQKKFFEVLCCLIDKYPEFVTREELIQSVWHGNFFVGDKAVNNAIWVLRKTLKEYDDNQYIITKRGHGYRLIIEPEEVVEQGGSSRKLTFIAAGLVMACLIGTSFFLNQEPSHSVDYLTKTSGFEQNPSVSPLGNEVAYSWRKPSQPSNIYVKGLVGDKAARQITFTDTDDHGPTWVDGGSALAFVSEDHKRSECKIKKVHLNTLAEETITDCNININTYVSADNAGTRLLVNKSEENLYRNGLYLIDLGQHPYAETRISCGDECDYEDKEAVFSPSGNVIVLSRRHDRLSENLFSYDLEKQVENQLTFAETDIKGLTVSSTGDVIFGAKKAGQNVAKSVSLDGGKVKEIGISGFTSPSFNFADDSIVFTVSSSLKGTAYVDLNSQKKVSRPLFEASFVQRNADYSAVNDKLVYVSGESGYLELWMSNVDGTGKQQLTFLENDIMTPNWSHDGKSIAFLTRNKTGDGNQIRVLNVSTRQVSTIESPFGTHNRPTWSIDDKSIMSAVSSDQGSKLHRFFINGNGTEIISNQQIRLAKQVTKTMLLFSKYSNGGLWMAELDREGTFEEAINLLSGQEFNTRYNWTVDGNDVYYTQFIDNIVELKRYSLSDDITESLLSLPREKVETFGNVTYAPNVNWLIYSTKQGDPSDIARLALK